MPEEGEILGWRQVPGAPVEVLVRVKRPMYVADAPLPLDTDPATPIRINVEAAHEWDAVWRHIRIEEFEYVRRMANGDHQDE